MGNSSHIRDSENEGVQVSFLTSFFRHNISAILATSFDFAVYSIGVLLLFMSNHWAAILGACFGAILAFYLGRNWSFKSTGGKLSTQSFRFAIVALVSIALNGYGVYFFTETMNDPHYMIPKVITAILVGVFANFPLQRYFVYK